ncbi:MAG: hypothetical protein JXA96_11745 [Sedimentisphaerales bacterium]|nr:hypothetical protein [Sedimentisphaerales bacterium]
MGTQDQSNKAEPQNEFLSGFKIKDRGIAQSEEKQPHSAIQAEINDGFKEDKSNSRIGSNPYQLTQQMSTNIPLEQVDKNFFGKKSGTGFIQKIKSKIKKEKSESGDTKQRVMMVMIPILFVIMIFMFRQVLSKPPQTSNGASVGNEPALAINDSSDNNIDWKIPNPLPVTNSVSINSGRNTSSSTGQDNTTDSTEYGVMYVRSILYSNDKPSVVIGDKIVYLNQEINGVVVVGIEKDYVVFEKEGKRWTQKIAEDIQHGGMSENIK